MKPIVVIGATAPILSLITVFTTAAAALSYDCGDVCVSTSGWTNKQTDVSTELAGSQK